MHIKLTVRSTDNSAAAAPGAGARSKERLSVLPEPKPDRSARPYIDLDSLKFERRREMRRPRAGAAMAAFYDEDGALSLTRVELLDSSERGLGLLSPVEIEKGVRFCLYSGSIPLPHSTGIVARCVREGGEFRVGLRCDPVRVA